MGRDLLLGCSFAVLVGLILRSVLARDIVKSIQKSARRKADDTGASSSSAASAGSDNYHVFLSFCGKDTRKTFGDHLYSGLVNAGFRVFRDDNELRHGEEISTNLFQAIKNSKISIPILSQNYASSEWCLQELVEMMECMKDDKHVVLPIFYRVEPTHVRHQTNSFGKHFSRLRKNSSEEDVTKWKQALQEVASLKGWESEKTADGYEGELVQMVVRKVWSELKKAFQLDVPEQLVGIKNAEEDIFKLLDDKLGATRIVGIYGMGGIGKTTLAKIVYNKLSDKFKHHSFLADIRESSQRYGIQYLQNQMISNILITNEQVYNVNEGIKIMASRFKHKKVLILLDDVDDIDQLKALVGELEWFKMGSKILITTRMRSVLYKARVKCQYKLEEIADDKSLIFFSRHAFLWDSPPREFESLSRDVMSNTGGLPLALEVIGSFLCGRDQAFWQGALKKLKEAPHEEVQMQLRISYDELSHAEKHIFLDIACFFIGYDLRIVSYMWDACNYYPTVGIETLSFMSLIKIGEDGKLKMHDQLRDLGREIVRQENEYALMYRSRLWVHDEALEVLQRTKGSQKDLVQALWLGSHLQIEDNDQYQEARDGGGPRSEFTTEQFETLPNLRLFTANNAKLIGDSQSLLPKLRWLQWRICPAFMATSFCLEKLVMLDLSRSDISELWEGWSHLKVAKHLKVLILAYCDCLSVTPDLSAFQNLEILILYHCKNLKEIHPSIGKVKGLVLLNLGNCQKIQELPQEIGQLKQLKELSVHGTIITELPCIASLKMLEVINAYNCESLIGLPDSIGHLVSLLTLNLRGCSELRGLPESIGSLKKLQRLLLSKRCGPPPRPYFDIPNSIGKLEDLTELELKILGICELPESIGDLKNLKILDISWNESLRKLPNAINKLGKLESLRAAYCTSLEGEFSINGLSSLRILDLAKTCISRILGEFDKLSPLEKLNLGYCKMLRSLPKSINKLHSLQHLDLANCEELQSLPELPACLTVLKVNGQHQTLPQLSHLIHLRELFFYGCRLLESMPELHSGLLVLCVSACDQLKELPQLSHLIHLKKLTFHSCRLMESIPELPSGLLEFCVSDCDQLKELPSLLSLEFLSELCLRSCRELTEIKGLEALKSLVKLTLSRCGKLSNLDGLEHLESLRYLCVSEFSESDAPLLNYDGFQVRSLDKLNNLEELELEDSRSQDLWHLRDRDQLSLNECYSIVKIKGLETLKKLKWLGINWVRSTDFDDLESCPSSAFWEICDV